MQPLSEAEKKRIRKRVLGEWRGARVKRDTGSYEHSVAELVPGILRKIGLQDQVAAEAITSEWRTIVGPFIGSNSRPVKLQGKVLTVAVLQSTLLYMLEREFKKEILTKVRARFGEMMVRDVRFTVG